MHEDPCSHTCLWKAGAFSGLESAHQLTMSLELTRQLTMSLEPAWHPKTRAKTEGKISCIVNSGEKSRYWPGSSRLVSCPGLPKSYDGARVLEASGRPISWPTAPVSEAQQKQKHWTLGVLRFQYSKNPHHITPELFVNIDIRIKHYQP